MAWEVHTLGGGEYLYNIFHGVAALTSGAGYKNIILISALIGLIWVLLENAFRNQFIGNIRWFIGFVLAYNVLFLPKVDVLVHDDLNTQKPYQVISNVPLALGVFASMTSSVGHEMTKLFETAFITSNNIKYHTHGLMFGSRLVDATSSFRIVDSTFAQNINGYMKQCVFYDILLHRYTLNELKESHDIWQFITKDPAKSRAFEYREGKTRKIVTCKEGAALLTPLWNSQIEKATTVFGLKIFPGITTAEARARLISQLPMAYNDIMDISKSASALIQQNMMINAISSAAEDFTSNTQNGVGSYLAVRSDIQTRTAFQASKRQGEYWLPILRIVLEVLFYGAFPLVFLLMLLPIGANVARGYFSIFLWLQSWGPLYAIVNMVMQGKAKAKTLAASALSDGNHGLTLVTKAGIETINQDVANMAGNVAWSIPFFAILLTAGARSVTGLATSMLAVPQSAANSAAGEVATGNISLGNSTLGNASYNNMNANKWSDSAIFDGGRMQTVNSMGGMSTYSSGGNEVHDMSATVSRLPNMQVMKNQTEAVHLTQAASQAMNTGTNLSTQADHSRSQGIDKAAQYMSSHNIGEGNAIRFNQHASAEARQSLNEIYSSADELSRTKQIDRATAFNMVLKGDGGFGIGSGRSKSEGSSAQNNNEELPGSTGKGNGASLSAGVGLGGNSDTRSQTSHSDSEKIYRAQQLDRHRNVVLNAIQDRSIEFTDSKGNSINESINQNFSEADRLDEQSRSYFDMSKSLSNQAQHVTSNTISTNREITPDIINHGGNIRDTITGRPMGKLKAAEILSNQSKYPEEYNLIMRHYEGSQSGTSQLSNYGLYQQQAANLGVSNLEQDYKTSSDNLKSIGNNKINYQDNAAKGQFAHATKDKGIDNNDIIDKVDDQIIQNASKLQNTQIDKADVAGEVKDKLKDDAFVTQMKSIGKSVTGIFSKQEPPKSNFNNEE